MSDPSTPKTFRVRWLLPIDQRPMEHAWVTVIGGRIADVGRGRPSVAAEDLGDIALLPGLVNAHTHLELSEFAGRVPPAEAMVPWIRSMVAVRGRGTDPASPTAVAAAREAIRGVVDDGTALVGDITNSLLSAPLLAEANFSGVVFHEILGFSRPDPEADVQGAWARVDETVGPPLRGAVVAHAPYSVSPALFGALAAHKRETPLAVHLGESRAELEFLRTGRGPFRDLLESFGAWTDAWTPPACDPVEYMDRVGYLKPGTIVVHGTHLDASGLARLRARHAVVVTCPRSNVWVGEGEPPISAFYASGVAVAIGTDSLASVSSLRMFDEIAAVRRAAPGIAPARILESATRVGADALGFGADFGTIAAGKRAVFAAVTLPASEGDVEEYLVSGVPADRVRGVRA